MAIVANLDHLDKKLKKRIKDASVVKAMVVELLQNKEECDSILKE